MNELPPSSRHPLAAFLARHRFARMVVAGAGNTAFGFLVFSALILAELPPWGALLLGFLCGTAFNFLTTGHYVFRQLSLRKYPRFIACYSLTYLINLALLHFLSGTTGSQIVAQAVVTIPVAVFSYKLMGRFVFTAPQAEGAESIRRAHMH